MTRQQLRQSFRPKKVRILFIGESPPHSGDFFYKGDSALLRHTSSAFRRACGWKFETGAEFLIRFKHRGCYLDDLCHTPINHLRNRSRKRKRHAATAGLTSRIEALRPTHIIIIMKCVRHDITKAARKAGFRGEIPAMPLPGFHHQPAFIRELAKTLRRIGV